MKPKKYRKRPVVIEAMKFEPWKEDLIYGSLDSANAIIEWAGKDIIEAFHYRPIDDNDGWCATLRIKTLEGKMDCSVGDYVICGVNGEFYPCKPDIFAKTYEPVEESNE